MVSLHKHFGQTSQKGSLSIHRWLQVWFFSHSHLDTYDPFLASIRFSAHMLVRQRGIISVRVPLLGRYVRPLQGVADSQNRIIFILTVTPPLHLKNDIK